MLQRGRGSPQDELRQSPCCSFCFGSVSLSRKTFYDTLNFRCAAGDEVARKPRLFFVSTSSTTTTLQTQSICYITSGTTITTCTGRKRRSIKIDGAQHADVKPSQLNQEVQSSQKEAKKDRAFNVMIYHVGFLFLAQQTRNNTNKTLDQRQHISQSNPLPIPKLTYALLSENV